LFLKKGAGSVGVQRQYSGTAGRIENSQVGVFLSYASGAGRALIDRRVLPAEVMDGRPDALRSGRRPCDTHFATKPELALEMITGAVAARTHAA
jgi:SRSO17 transposase